MVNVTMLRKTRGDFEREAARYSQRIKIKPFRLALAYYGDTLINDSTHTPLIHINVRTAEEWQFYQLPLLVSIIRG